jgi:hypothetical protein
LEGYRKDTGSIQDGYRNLRGRIQEDRRMTIDLSWNRFTIIKCKYREGQKNLREPGEKIPGPLREMESKIERSIGELPLKQLQNYLLISILVTERTPSL